MLCNSCAIKSCFIYTNPRHFLRAAQVQFLAPRPNVLRLQQFSSSTIRLERDVPPVVKHTKSDSPKKHGTKSQYSKKQSPQSHKQEDGIKSTYSKTKPPRSHKQDAGANSKSSKTKPARSQKQDGGTGPGRKRHTRERPHARGKGSVDSKNKTKAGNRLSSAIGSRGSNIRRSKPSLQDMAKSSKSRKPAVDESDDPVEAKERTGKKLTRRFMLPEVRERKKGVRRERREKERQEAIDAGEDPKDIKAKRHKQREKERQEADGADEDIDLKAKAPTEAVKKSKNEVSTFKKTESWQVQKEALKRKFGEEGWNPRKRLSPDVIEGIRALHSQSPETFTTPLLAQEFEVSPEAIRRILKTKWRPSNEQMEERRERWERRGIQVWEKYAQEKGMKPPKKWRILGVGKGEPGEPPVWRRRPQGFGEPPESQPGGTGGNDKRGEAK